jgi:hypothetical protein
MWKVDIGNSPGFFVEFQYWFNVMFGSVFYGISKHYEPFGAKDE